MQSNFWRLTSLLLGLFALTLTAPGSSSAATLTVTDLGDSGAPGQLRTLINGAAPGDKIVIPEGTIRLITLVKEDANATGDIDIHKDLTIQGIGADRTTIESAGGDRVFDIFAPATVTISNMTIRGGFGSHFGGGGGIRNAGTLTLTDVTVTANTASGLFGGGGILNTGTATLINCTVSGNMINSGRGAGIGNTGTMTLTNVTVTANVASTPLGGGGIANTGTMTLTNVTISGNTAPDGGGIFNGGTIEPTDIGGDIVVTPIGGTLSLTGGIVSNNTGGGIFNFAGTATLTNATISGNTANSGIGNVGTMALTNVTVTANTASGLIGVGGGIANVGTMTMTNVTVSGNMADQSGGGIANGVVIISMTADLSGGPVVRQFSEGTLTMTNVTVTGNTPGGIFGFECPSSFGCGKSSARLENTIVANNLSGGNCSGDPETIISLGHNLDSGSSCGFTGPGDLSNTDPKLGPLQYYGGPIQTHVLFPGSPAIDAGDNSGCPATDQRGVARPQGAACDIGANEFGLPTAGVGLNGSVFHTGQTITYQATLIPGFTPTQVDIYLGVLLPDETTFLSLVQSSPGVISTALGPSPVSFSANVTLAPLAVPFTFTFTGTEPVGTYFTYAGLAVAGSNPFVPSNQLSLGVQAFQFSP